MIKKIARYRLVSLLSLAGFLFAAGGFVWALAELAGARGPFILHFSDMNGITSVGGLSAVAMMGVLGIVIILIDFFVAIELEERDSVLGKIVAAMALLLGVLLFLAFAAIIRVNV